MRHEVASDLAARIGDAKVEEQPRRLHPAGAQEDGRAALAMILVTLSIDDRADPAAAVELERHHARLRANLGTVRDCKGQIGGIHAGLGGGATALVTGTAIDAGLPLSPMRLIAIARDQCCRRVGGGDANCRTAPCHRIGRSVAGDRRIGVAARGVPRIVGRAGYACEMLDLADVADQFGVIDRPVRTLAGQRLELQVARIGAGAEGAPVQCRSADAHTRIV